MKKILLLLSIFTSLLASGQSRYGREVNTSIDAAIENKDQMTCLWIENQNLGKLPEGLAQCEHLDWIHATGCQLIEIPKSFGSLSKLDRVDFSNNKIEDISPLLSCDEMWFLNLQGNNISTIPNEISNLKKIDELDLSNNKIREIPEAIGELNQLTELLLDDNEISQLPNSIFLMESLVKLSLKGNKLTSIVDSFHRMERIDKLDFSNNQITEIPQTVWEAASDINFSHNQISEIRVDSNEEYPISRLDLSYNILSEIPQNLIDRFANYYCINALIISHNQLQSLPNLSHVSVEILDVSNNKFTTLPVGRIEHNPLEEFNASNNSISRIPKEYYNSRLNKLDLSNNKIISIDESICDAISLKYLDLSNNRLHNLPMSVGELTELYYLNISGNQIPQSVIFKLKKLLPNCEIIY